MREHMDSLVSKAERFNKRKQALQSQGSKLKQAVAYERSSDASKKVQEQEGEVAALRAKLQKLEKQEAAGRQARQDQEADLEERVRARHRMMCLLAGQINSAVVARRFLRMLLLLMMDKFHALTQQARSCSSFSSLTQK